MPTQSLGVRDAYADHPSGPSGWYREHGPTYRNPHALAVEAMVVAAVQRWPCLFGDSATLLDLCCGSGEVTRTLRRCGMTRVEASDPYTSEAFQRETGGSLVGTWTFADIAGGALENRRWSTVLCSYALHLCESSRLAAVCTQLSLVTDSLIVITPNKRPELPIGCGLALVDEYRDLTHRTRLRRYDRVRPDHSSNANGIL